MCGRAQPQDVEQQAFVVALPTVWDESALRPPAVRECGCAIASPVPIGALVERIGEAADLGLVGGVTVKIGGDRQRAREQKGRIDGRQLALPNAPACFDVQKMIEEAVVAGGLGLGTLRALQQVSQL